MTGTFHTDGLNKPGQWQREYEREDTELHYHTDCVLNDSAVPVPLVCLAVPLHRSEVIGSVAGTGPSCAQGSTVPPEEEVLGGTGGPQGSALGGVTATGGGEEMEGRGRVNATQPQTREGGHEMRGKEQGRDGGGGLGSSRSLSLHDL